ncbi:hypothetical protein CK222_23745 [Mesorhizobium sp. WSM3866]|uniref:hypothetical protein n=1 Tax=Mesorhizobium sp. WSM3866 TaxID=422271 RepID=UPI000BAF701F|nr:hypothetical protein [Mesorhizobium sp. WSM3866]PBB41185.1 hypothetical protein CK222_23745 [Mesorhizobium sp. WSM3866]
MISSTEDLTTMAIDMKAANRLPPRGDEIRVFTRFEYALKDGGFGKAGRKNVVEADWDLFASRELKAPFFAAVKAKALAPTLMTNPPSRQTLQGSTLGWDTVPPPANVTELLVAVRRVRNNLVHGGKSGDQDSDRNDSLVAEAIEVLLEALRCHSDLRAIFERRW